MELDDKKHKTKQIRPIKLRNAGVILLVLLPSPSLEDAKTCNDVLTAQLQIERLAARMEDSDDDDDLHADSYFRTTDEERQQIQESCIIKEHRAVT